VRGRERKREGRARGTEWRRPIACLLLHVIFRKRTTNYRALLQKMTYKDKASYGSSPPCREKTTALEFIFMSTFAKKPIIVGLFCGK